MSVEKSLIYHVFGIPQVIQEKNLYRRRCKIISIDEYNNGTRYHVYSEGLEEEELLAQTDFKVSKF